MGEQLANKIAAGEVVDRPASVIKELVENAIDAQSTFIEILVSEGGLEKIKVVDNGIGMDRTDAQLAFERHATSKLKDDRDLFHLTTLGFRGEALPSIAAVSQVQLQTWDGESTAGTAVTIHGGKRLLVEDAPPRRGTSIEIEHLFYNTPARYKYLKSVHTEIGHIADTVNRLALAHPGIAFKLSHNGKLLLQTNGSGHLNQVIYAIYGKEAHQALIELEYHDGLDFELKGAITKPEFTRSNRNYMTIVINGRYIRSYPITQALLQGYHTYLPINRYPLAVLHIQMEPSLLDINVHPAKLEARLSKEQELYTLVTKVIHDKLRAMRHIPEPLPAKETSSTKQGAPNPVSERVKERNPSYIQASFELYRRMEEKDQHQQPQLDELTQQKPIPRATEQIEQIENIEQTFSVTLQKEKHQEEHDLEKRELEKSSPDLTEQPSIYVKQADEVANRLPYLEPIGQLHGTYIIAQNDQGMYLIDQHAAQERIWYEHFVERLNHPGTEQQTLLLPLVFELTAGESMMIKENQKEFEAIGLFFEEFGEDAYILRSHPWWFPKDEEESLIREVIDYIISKKGKVEWRFFRDHVASLMACKQAIKANRYLTREEIESLLNQLRETSNGFTCPHGRPITIFFKTYDLEKMFKRVM